MYQFPVRKSLAKQGSVHYQLFGNALHEVTYLTHENISRNMDHHLLFTHPIVIACK